MITRVENIFTELFATIPAVGTNNKITFHYGEQKELNSVLLTKQSNGTPCYPMLWYNMPNQLDGNNHYAEGVCEFVLAHNTQLDWFNDQRFTQVFDAVLYPNFNLVIQALDKANGISLLNVSGTSNKWSYENYPNYGSPTTFEGKEETKQIDFWDAIKFQVNLNIKRTACDFTKIRYDLNNI